MDEWGLVIQDAPNENHLISLQENDQLLNLKTEQVMIKEELEISKVQTVPQVEKKLATVVRKIPRAPIFKIRKRTPPRVKKILEAVMHDHKYLKTNTEYGKIMSIQGFTVNRILEPVKFPNLIRKIIAKPTVEEILRLKDSINTKFNCNLEKVTKWFMREPSNETQIKSEPLDDFSEGSYKCLSCNFAADNKDIYKNHTFYNHHNNKSTRSIQWGTLDYKYTARKRLEDVTFWNRFKPNITLKWFNCSLCPFMTSEQFLLKHHIKNRHVGADKVFTHKIGDIAPREWFIDNPTNTPRLNYSVQEQVSCTDRRLNLKVGWYLCSHCNFKSQDPLDVSFHSKLTH